MVACNRNMQHKYIIEYIVVFWPNDILVGSIYLFLYVTEIYATGVLYFFSDHIMTCSYFLITREMSGSLVC
jgi:hypothetical protein